MVLAGKNNEYRFLWLLLAGLKKYYFAMQNFV